mgnify:CR=1 FL=1
MYVFGSEEAKKRWYSERLIWEVNYELGYPLLVANDDEDGFVELPYQPLPQHLYAPHHLWDIIQQGKAINAMSVLRKYERWRKADNLAMMVAMDGLKNLFGFPSLKKL